MTSNHRWAAIIVAPALLSLSLAACGDDDAEGTPPPAEVPDVEVHAIDVATGGAEIAARFHIVGPDGAIIRSFERTGDIATFDREQLPDIAPGAFYRIVATADGYVPNFVTLDAERMRTLRSAVILLEPARPSGLRESDEQLDYDGAINADAPLRVRRIPQPVDVERARAGGPQILQALYAQGTLSADATLVLRGDRTLNGPLISVFAIDPISSRTVWVGEQEVETSRDEPTGTDEEIAGSTALDRTTFTLRAADVGAHLANGVVLVVAADVAPFEPDADQGHENYDVMDCTDGRDGTHWDYECMQRSMQLATINNCTGTLVATQTVSGSITATFTFALGVTGTVAPGEGGRVGGGGSATATVSISVMLSQSATYMIPAGQEMTPYLFANACAWIECGGSDWFPSCSEESRFSSCGSGGFVFGCSPRMEGSPPPHSPAPPGWPPVRYHTRFAIHTDSCHTAALVPHYSDCRDGGPIDAGRPEMGTEGGTRDMGRDGSSPPPPTPTPRPPPPGDAGTDGSMPYGSAVLPAHPMSTPDEMIRLPRNDAVTVATTFRWRQRAGRPEPSDLSLGARDRDELLFQVMSLGSRPFARFGLSVHPIAADTPYRVELEIPRSDESGEVVLSLYRVSDGALEWSARAPVAGDLSEHLRGEGLFLDVAGGSRARVAANAPIVVSEPRAQHAAALHEGACGGPG